VSPSLPPAGYSCSPRVDQSTPPVSLRKISPVDFNPRPRQQARVQPLSCCPPPWPSWRSLGSRPCCVTAGGLEHHGELGRCASLLGRLACRWHQDSLLLPAPAQVVEGLLSDPRVPGDLGHALPVRRAHALADLAPWWMGQTEWTSLLTVGAPCKPGGTSGDSRQNVGLVESWGQWAPPGAAEGPSEAISPSDILLHNVHLLLVSP
jgi:hypothetical protein